MGYRETSVGENHKHFVNAAVNPSQKRELHTPYLLNRVKVNEPTTFEVPSGSKV